MKILKKLLVGILIFSTITQASWWGDLSRGERAAIIIGSALLLTNPYQNQSREIRKDYTVKDLEAEYIVENEVYLEELKRANQTRNIILEYIDNPSLGKVIYSDDRSVIIEMYDGSRFILDRLYLNNNR